MPAAVVKYRAVGDTEFFLLLLIGFTGLIHGCFAPSVNTTSIINRLGAIENGIFR